MRSKRFQELENSVATGEELKERIADEAVEAGLVSADGEHDKDNEGVIMEWVKGAAIAVVIAVAILQFIKPTIVNQHSMEPNFNPNDYLFISKQSYRLLGGTPKLGDVIVFSTETKTEDGDNKLLIKRVIGVPGDEISIAGGKVYVNGKIIDDSYTKDRTTNGDIDKLIVPSDSVFCLGDNRIISIDSRSDDVGLISYDDILGKVVFRLLPLSDMGMIHNPYDEE